MPRRQGATEPQTRPAAGAERAEPVCFRRCGFTGFPDDRATPYIDCGGDPTRHLRRMVDPRFVREPPAVPPPAPAVTRPPAVTYPDTAAEPKRRRARPVQEPRPDGATARGEIVDRITCPLCGRPDTAVIRYVDGSTVVIGHGPPGNRCRQSENPPAEVSR
jgi:hypothetical protein